MVWWAQLLDKQLLHVDNTATLKVSGGLLVYSLSEMMIQAHIPHKWREVQSSVAAMPWRDIALSIVVL